MIMLALALQIAVGPNLNSPTTLQDLSFSSSYYWQSLTVPRPNGFGSNRFSYVKLRFLFDGSALGNDRYFTKFHFGLPDPENGGHYDVPFVKRLDQNKNGMVQAIIRNPGTWLPDQRLFLMFYSDFTGFHYQNCGDTAEIPDPCTYESAHVGVISGDVYPGGRLFGFTCEDPGPDCAENDLAFSAQFHVTPEPSTWILLGTGLAGIGALSYRRKRRGQIIAPPPTPGITSS